MNIRLVIVTTLLAGSGSVFHAQAAPQGPDAQAIYNENCKKCHGVLGTPPKTMKAKYSKIATFDAAFLVGRNEDSVEKVLMNGVGKAEDMKSFKQKLSKEEMGAVAKYVIELAKKTH
jgi:mono/diheme cytochrome c family protein